MDHSQHVDAVTQHVEAVVSQRAEAASQHMDAVRSLVAGEPDWIERSPLGERLWSATGEFYAARGYTPAWIDGNRPTARLEALVEALRESEHHGLDVSAYPIDEYERLHEASQTWLGTRFEAARVPELDAKLTYGYLRYAAALSGWTSRPQDVSRHWVAQPHEVDLVELLTEAVETDRVGDTLERLVPTHPQYARLQAALQREREQPAGHADRIRMNLERWRWMPRDLGERYILVNVPAYMMHVMEGATPALSMRVIVGRPDWSTPLFSDRMSYLVFSPYWNIPPNILRDETLPRAVKDPQFLVRSNIEIMDDEGTLDPMMVDWSDPSATAGLRFRQRPGPSNALGLVKFMFPNEFNVYLHDTPGDRLFARERRAMSHGCVRVEDPLALAEYVLRDRPEWTRARITRAMHAGREQSVRLTEPLPVHIGYWTAWVEDDGSLTVTDDPYKIDPAHARLFEPRVEPAPERVEASLRTS